MKIIELNHGLVALVDDEDYEELARYKWYAVRIKNTHYAKRRGSGDRKTFLLMHRVVAKATPGVQVDHRDGNGLNNTKENLRLATNQQNSQNKRAVTGASRFKGIYSYRGRWVAQIRADGRRLHLGRFANEMDAAAAYDGAARKYHGEFAATNESLGLLAAG